MMKKRLLSLFSAIALVTSLFTLLPNGALKASAAGKYNIRTSYNAENGTLTVEWDKGSGDCNYSISFYNDCADGADAGQFKIMPVEEISTKFVYAGQQAKLIQTNFGVLYGNGGMNYKVYVENQDKSYGEYSSVFRTNVPFAPTPQYVHLCENGLIGWIDDWEGMTQIKLYDKAGTLIAINEQSGSTDYTTALKDLPMQAGKSYYAEVRYLVSRGKYTHRPSPIVKTETVAVKDKTGITNMVEQNNVIQWAAYPHAYYYKIEFYLCINNQSGSQNVKVKEYDLYDTSKKVVKELDMSEFKDLPSGGYKIYITALDSNCDKALSERTTTSIIDYDSPWTLIGDINHDAKITSDDAVIIARMAAKYSNYSRRFPEKVADINQDGRVTADDAIIAARYAANYGQYRSDYTKWEYNFQG